MNRMSRFHRAPFWLQLHHGINPIIILITIVAIIFVGYFFFSNDESPVSHQTSDVKVSQQTPNRPKRTKPKSKSTLKLRSSRQLRESNLIKIKEILSSSRLSKHQKSNLIKAYQKLNFNQQKRILNLVNKSQRHFKNSQTKLRILEQCLKSKTHDITSDLNQKRL